MVSTPRWGGLRIEPYDPDARDADGDGIVQEGSAWERPVGTRILDELGREIVKGATSSKLLTGATYRDRNGKTVEYTPKGVPDGGELTAPTSALGRMGAPSLRELGHVSAHDLNVAARTAVPETAPEVAPTVSRGLPSTKGGEAFLTGSKRLEARVTDAYGPLRTRDDAVAALTSAYPRAEVATLEAQLPDGPLSPRDRGHVVGLLHASLDDPKTAAVTRISLNATHLGDRPSDTTWGIVDPGDGSLPRIDPAILLNPLAEGLSEDTGIGQVLATLAADGALTPDEAEQFAAIYAATHAQAHANHLRQTFAHAELPLSPDGQDQAWWFQVGKIVGHDFAKLAQERKYRKDPTKLAAHIAETMREPASLEALAGRLKRHETDDLSGRYTLEALAEDRARGLVSPQEVFSELLTLEAAGIDPVALPDSVYEPRSFTANGQLYTIPPPSSSKLTVEAIQRERRFTEPLAELRAWLESDHLTPPPPPSAADTRVGRAGGITYTPPSSTDRDRSLTKAAKDWIIDPSGIRKQAEAIMGRSQQRGTFDSGAGVEGSDVEMVGAHTFLTEIRDRGTDIGMAYRGLDPGEEVAREIAGLQPGDVFEAPLIGVTRERHIAGARFNGERPGGALIVFEDGHGISINAMLPEHQYADEDEWLLSGQFEVVSIETREARLPVKPPRGSALSDQAESIENIYGSDYPEDMDPSTPITVVRVRQKSVFDPDVNTPEIRATDRPEPSRQAELDLTSPTPSSGLAPINQPTFTVDSFEKGIDWSVIPEDTLAQYRQQLQDDINVGLGPNMGRFGFEPTEDKALVTLVRAQGYDVPPTPVSAEEAASIVDAGGLEIWRGLAAASHADMLRNGDYYGGRGVSGGGHYFAVAPSMGGEYATPTAGDYTKTLTKMILRPEAKVANIDDIKALMSTIDNDPNNELLTYDYGHFAIAMGYDAIRVPETEETSEIVVVLNRGACVLPPQPDNDELRSLVSDLRAGRPKAVEQEQSLRELMDSLSTMSKAERAELWVQTLRARREAGLFVRSYEHWAEMDLMAEVQESFQEFQDSPSFRAMSPQEQLTYLESVIASRNDRGLYTGQYSQLATSLRAQIPSARPSVPDDDEDGYDGSGAFV